VALINSLVGEGGLTIMVVEHDMDVVFSVSSTIVVLHEGKVLCSGRPEAVRCNEVVQKVYLGDDDRAERADGRR